MFAKWLEEYRRISQKTLLLSKMSAFLVFLFAFLGLWRIFRSVYYNPMALNLILTNFIIAVVLHLIIGIIFLTRFIFLFFNSTKSFLSAQIVWLISIALIIGAHIATRFTLYGSLFNPATSSFDVYPQLILYAADIFAVLVFIYLLTSPIQRLIIAVISYFKSK